MRCFAVWAPPPYVHLAPPDVIHVINETRPSPFFAVSSTSVYYVECKATNKKWGRPGNEASNSLLEDQIQFRAKILVTGQMYHIHGLISAYAYFQKLQGNMRLLPNMCLIMKAKLTTPPKPRRTCINMIEESSCRGR